LTVFDKCLRDTLAERLGHSRIEITMDTYSHVMPTLQREAADVLDRVLGDWESLQAGG
jgi:integrase